jgi:DNA polymerase III subunit delta'
MSDILGQAGAIQTIARAISARKLAQAYLFSGPSGVGKASTALALAGALNCLNSPGQGCLECLSCQKIQRGLHPDLHVIVPDGVFIKIDQVRALEQHLGFPPHEGRYRVIIIDGAEQLNPYAANALLKSVEEPRPSTVFILVSAATHRIVPTLISRCQRLRFLPLSSEALLSVVQRHHQGDPLLQRATVGLAEGSARRALDLLQDEQMSSLQAALDALIEATSQNTVVRLFQATTEVGKDRLYLAQLLDLWRTWLRDLLLLTENLDEGRLINTDRLLQLREAAKGQTYRGVLHQLRAVDETHAALRGNVNPTLAMENLVLSLRQAVFP